MRLMACTVILLIAAGSVAAQTIGLDRSPSWLLDSKRVSMHHSLSFSYGSYYKTYESLYANSIRYALSSKLTLSGTFGYYQIGGKYSNYKSMLHGFGITYQPSKYFQVEFLYRGISPISKPGGTSSFDAYGGR